MSKLLEMELLMQGDTGTEARSELTPMGDGRSFIAPAYEGPGRYYEIDGVGTVLAYSHDRIDGSVYKVME